MSLPQFSIIVAIDASNGISKGGFIPWRSQTDMEFFRDTTIGKGRNAVIMGRVTYETIPEEFRPLKNRYCVVVSRTWRQEEHQNIGVCSSLSEALISLGGNSKSYDDIFVIGGEQIYNEVLRDYMYLCKKVYVTQFKTDYQCDQFFNWDEVKDYTPAKDPKKTRDYNRYLLVPNILHQEHQYLSLIQKIIEDGEVKPDRTGTGTRSIFGARMEFDISERIPILTTKKINFEAVIKELLFFISGKTDTKILEEQGVKVWKANTAREELDAKELEYEEGDMGPAYGHQWRHWNAEYDGAEEDYTEQGIDQLSNLIDGIRKDPHSRRHILSAWNVGQLDEMVLPPCHILVQFNVSGDRRYLDCQLYQRSGDMFLGVPWNISCYSFLTYMVAHITGLRPRNFVHIIGDAHVYSNHISQVQKQISRTPRPFPHLTFRRGSKIHEIDDFDFDSFIVQGYESWPQISAPMAV